MLNFGTVLQDSTLVIPISTNDASGGTVNFSGTPVVGDVDIYKNGSATQRSSTAGFTVTSPFDGTTGLHIISIDLSDNTDAGFYSLGDTYLVSFTPTVTVDSQTIEAWIAQFTIESQADQNLRKSGSGIITGTVSGTPTTTSNESNLTGFANDDLIGRTIVFTGGTANGCAAVITDYASTNGTVSYTSGIATASVANDTFVIV